MSTQFEVRVAGIPAQVRVDRFLRVKGSHSRNAPSDLDFHGYTEVDFTILDRRGRPAPWLEWKMTDAEKDRINNLVVEKMEGRDE